MYFVAESVFEASVADVFAFHERPDAFEVLQPPWEKVEIVQPPTGLEIGTRVIVYARIGPFKKKLVAEHTAYEHNVLFEDTMLEGPFAAWRHRHLFFAHQDGCRLRDEIEYEPPLGWLGALADPLVIRPRLERMFEYRHDVTAQSLK